MTTPIEFIQLAIDAGRLIDERFPGLRERDANSWMDKVVWLAHLRNTDVKIGRKARSSTARVSPDTVGFYNNTQSFYAVSIIRDLPGENPWRQQPEDHGLVYGQVWYAPFKVDIGEGPTPPPTNTLENRVTNLETWARNIGFKG